MPARADIDPEWFRYSGPILSRYDPYGATTGTGWVSYNAPNVQFNVLVFPQAIAIKNLNVTKSLNVGVPGGTGAASTGSQGYTYSHGVSFFRRQDYAANSSNLTFVTSGSAGLTATLGYSSTSQQFGLTWLTDASGGTNAYTTTSSDAAWSKFGTGPKLFPIPFSGPVANSGISLVAGEYFVGHQHSSTTATSNSNVTLLSVSQLRIVPQGAPFGLFGSSVSVSTAADIVVGGEASAVTTATTMAASVITSGGAFVMLQNFSNV